MVYLFLQVATTVLFQLLLRFGQMRRGNAIAAGAVNYVVAALFALGRFLLEGSQAAPTSSPPSLASSECGLTVAVSLGCLNGFLFASHLLVVLAGFEVAGVGVTVAVTTSSAVIPVLVSWYAWSGPMNLLRWAAVGLLPVAMVLMRPRQVPSPREETSRDGPAGRLRWKADAILLLSFLMSGSVQTIHKAFDVYAGAPLQPAYHLSLFSSAATCGLIYAGMRRIPLERTDAWVGIPLGLANTLSLFFLLRGLQALPATVFFPVSSTAVIGLNLFLVWLIWGEEITRRQLAGIFIAMAVVGLARPGSE